MQFVRNGPDIPERLLQAHEDGRVVFFCGAGISCPVLPGFAGLVCRLYTKFRVTPNDRQKKAIKTGQYDFAVGLLEAEVTGGRAEVRKELASILRNLTKSNKGTTAHESLLTLSRNREDGSTRLVTTNFDRLFEMAIADKPAQIKRFRAPLLPIQKKKWNGLVYLHGLLPEDPTSDELARLVVSDADFGREYLTEGWAARFVSELFRNYIVCFVGYRLNDPVLRYITAAIADEHEQGEPPLEIFAFGSYSRDEEEEKRKEWEDKNVTPILYLKDDEHTRLLNTLREWSETYRYGVCGKERIVTKYAKRHPSESTKENDFVSRVMWALSDPSGLPARCFAKLDPVPSLDWLDPLLEKRYNRSDLDRFCISNKAGFDKWYTFSLLRRPSPSASAPCMTLVNTGEQNSRWDEVMQSLAPWLTRHLNNSNLLLWMTNLGGSPHPNLVKLIESKLDKLNELKRDNNTTELEHIRSNAPDAIPNPSMQTLWHLLLTDRVSTGHDWEHYFALSLWKTRFKRYGLTTTLRLELLKCLAPRVSLQPAEIDDNNRSEHIKKLVGWQAVLFEDDVIHGLKELAKDRFWINASPDLLTELSSLLRDALDLTCELGGTDDQNYLSHFPISELVKNMDECDRIHNWAPLISLICNAWLSMSRQSPERARYTAEGWLREPYPLFRRLAFFAATQGEAIPSRQGLNWLLADEHQWLWSPETKRETMRLLVALAPQLTKDGMIELEKAILNGPPQVAPEKHIEPEHQARIADGDIWLRLAKIKQAGATLSKNGRKKLAELSDKHPDRKLDENELDEFTPSSLVRVRDGGNFSPTPRRRRELTEWIKQPSTDHRQIDDWQQRCRNNFATTACALYALSKEGDWPANHWSVALQEWSEEKLAKRSWRYMAPLLANATDEQLQTFVHELSFWLRATAKTFKGRDEIFLTLCKRVLYLKDKNELDSDNDYVMRAVNHSIGCATGALLSWWYRRKSEDGQGLPNELKPTFTELCNSEDDKFRHGRVLLAGGLLSLFRVDQKWTKEHLLPLFNWQASETEACAVWQGFLINPRLCSLLMEVLKRDFLETASHYEMIANYSGRRTSYGEQYASLLASAAINRFATFEAKELAAAVRALPPDGLSCTAQTLARLAESSGKQGADYWRNRAAPFMREIWPQTRDKIYPAVMTDLGRVCIAAQDSFPEAFDQLKYWLQPTTNPSQYYDRYHHTLLQQLNKTKICSHSPEQALDFLDLVIPKRQCYIPRELRACLETIQTSKPELGRDTKYQRLMERVRQQEEG